MDAYLSFWSLLSGLILISTLTEPFKKLEIIQYNAVLIITSAIKCTLRDHIYREFELEWWFEDEDDSKMVPFNGFLPSYLKSYIRYCEGVHISANQNNRKFSTIKSFFPYCIKEWNNLREEFRKIESTVQFKTKNLSFIRLKENSTLTQMVWSYWTVSD